jgi:hypothetical protein
MAVIARAEALASALESDSHSFGPQVWLDPEHGLVAGVFPSPMARFDFASETAVPLSSSEPTTRLAGQASAPKRQVSLLHEAKRVVQICEIETRHAVYRLGSSTQMLIHGLNLIEEARPGTLEKLSHRKKQSKRPVAKTRAALYDVRHPETHSAQLKSGWYVGTNNKAAEARGVLRQAVEIAGLVWGTDFAIRRAG